MFFRASARANDEYSHSSTASSSSAISDRSPRSECVLQRERERSFFQREREERRQREEERNFSASLFSLFLVFPTNQRGARVEDPSCGSESVSAVKKDGHRNARRRRIFFFLF